MQKIIIIMIFSFQFVSCQNRIIKLTTKQNLSMIKAPSSLYTNDSIRLINLIKNEIKNHQGGYYSKSYDDDTILLIDTIMYSSSYKKLIFFVIDKKENKKIYPDNFTEKDVKVLIKNNHTKLSYKGCHYTGKAYLGIRNDNKLGISHFGLTTAHYNNIKDVKNRQKQLYFEEYSTIDDKKHKYNLDDKRFWNKVDIWKQERFSKN